MLDEFCMVPVEVLCPTTLKPNCAYPHALIKTCATMTHAMTKFAPFSQRSFQLIFVHHQMLLVLKRCGKSTTAETVLWRFGAVCKTPCHHAHKCEEPAEWVSYGILGNKASKKGLHHTLIKADGLNVDNTCGVAVDKSNFCWHVPAKHFSFDAQQTSPHNFCPPPQQPQMHLDVSMHLASLSSHIKGASFGQQHESASPRFLTPGTTDSFPHLAPSEQVQTAFATMHAM